MKRSARKALLSSAVLLLPAFLAAQAVPAVKDTEGLFLDMSKVNLGTITSDEDKQRYIYTIQLEKARITRKTLKGVYENAFDLYRKGEFDAAKELAGRIIAIDPGYEDAAILRRASEELHGSQKPRFSEKKLIESKFEEGMALYRQGRLVEATGRWEEAVKLSPTNLKARYWLKKARKEMAEEHFRRGERAYRQHRLREALDQWYSALVLNPRYPRLPGLIARAESETRDADANEKLQEALNLYSQGATEDALRILDTILETGPGNTKAIKLMAEIRAEIAGQHVTQGRQYYEGRKFERAIAEWKKAVTFGYDSRAADQLIARAKEAMRREDARRSSQQHYLSGVIYFQKGDYVKARDEWTLALQLDPGNSDAKAGLERIEKLYGGK